MTIVIAGATGFIGKSVLKQGLSKGLTIRVVARRDPPDGIPAEVDWRKVDSLNNVDSVGEAFEGMKSVINLVGNAKCFTKAQYRRDNVQTAVNLAKAAEVAKVKRFVHVSSLASKQPEISKYGFTKRESEKEVRKLKSLEALVVRPPAVYGEGDEDVSRLLEMISNGRVYWPHRGKASIISVDTLASFLLWAADTKNSVHWESEPDDGKVGGWGIEELVNLAGKTLSPPVNVKFHRIYPIIFRNLGPFLDLAANRKVGRLVKDHAKFLCHPNWVSDPLLQPDRSLWAPALDCNSSIEAEVRRFQGILPTVP